MSTLLQLRTDAATRYRDISAVTVTAATWTNYINEGYEVVIADSPFWPFLEVAPATISILAGANSAALPTNGWRVLSVYNDTDNLPMDELQGRRSGIDAFPDGATYTGVPTLYRLYGNTLQVFPWATVATTLTVEYAGVPVALADDGTPVFPRQYHAALLHYALEQALMADGDLKAAGAHEARWRGILGQMRSDLLGARGDSYPQIVDVGW